MNSIQLLGVIIFAIGLIALIAFGLYKFFSGFFEMPFFVSFGLIAIIIGIIIVLISLTIERKKDLKEETK